MNDCTLAAAGGETLLAGRCGRVGRLRPTVVAAGTTDPAWYLWWVAYSGSARAARCCQAFRTDGELCRAWAKWGDPEQFCAAHSQTTGDSKGPPPCKCAAYQWPHRPGGGLCCWPDEPDKRCPTPTGTHLTHWRDRRRFTAFFPPSRRQRAFCGERAAPGQDARDFVPRRIAVSDHAEPDYGVDEGVALDYGPRYEPDFLW
jgi:hypothetical protein